MDSKIVPSNYSFLETLKNPDINTIFLSPTTTDETETRLNILMKEKQQVLIAVPQKY